MAKTFYKYVQRDQEARVDWNEVAKDFTESLKSESDNRQQRKDELKKAHDETLKSLQEPPQGDNQTLNASIQGFANSAMKQSTLMYDLLTSGQLKPRDYKISMQNLADDSQGLYDVWTQYSEDYNSMLERQNVPEGQLYSDGAKIENYMWQNMEFFSNFKNYKPTIDPQSGRVYYAKIDKDGNVSTNPNDRASIIDLRSRLRTKYDNVDVDSLTTKVTNQIGKWVWEQKLPGRNGVEVLDNMRGAEGTERREQYEDYKTNSVNALMVNKLDNATILTNHVGTNKDNKEAYDFTWDPNEAKGNPNLILLKKNPDGSGQPEPQLTDAQEETVRKYLGTRIDIKIDEIRKMREHYDPKYSPDYGNLKKYEREMSPDVFTFNQLIKLGQGDEEEQRGAIEHLRTKSGMADLDFVSTTNPWGGKRYTKISFRDKNNVTQTIDVSDFTTENFVNANASHFLSADANIDYIKGKSEPYKNLKNQDLSGETIKGEYTKGVKSTVHAPKSIGGMTRAKLEEAIVKLKADIKLSNPAQAEEKKTRLKELEDMYEKKQGDGMAKHN